jgi:deazaflavin-dependent oxidoreductase (nitroreductase family)
MREDVRQALAVDPETPIVERTIDITTTGRRSGQPRRIETAFQRLGDSFYLTGTPRPRPRAWLLNLGAEPRFTFHLKHSVVADLPATAAVITDPGERREILTPIVEGINRRRVLDNSGPQADLEDWIARSPLAKVSFDETD